MEKNLITEDSVDTKRTDNANLELTNSFANQTQGELNPDLENQQKQQQQQLNRVRFANVPNENNNQMNNNQEPPRISFNQNNFQGSRGEQYSYSDQVEYPESDYTCYQKVFNCCGVMQAWLRKWLPCICCCCPYPFVTVRQSEQGILERFGQYRKIVGPGMHEVNPATERIIKLNKKTQVVSIEKQTILTKDNLTVFIDAVVYFRIIDPKKVQYRLIDVIQCVREITISALRTICGENNFQLVLEERERVSEEIAGYLYEHIKDWGILVEYVFIKDMIIDQGLQQAMSAAAKMKRVGESKVISASADVQSATLFREAAELLNSRAAMQIRYLDTINSLANNNNPKITFIKMEDDEFKDEQEILDVDQTAQSIQVERLLSQQSGSAFSKQQNQIIEMQEQQNSQESNSLLAKK